MPTDKLTTDIIEKINQAEQDITAKRAEWLSNYKMYRGYRDDLHLSGRSAVSIPVAFEWVEVVLSRLFDVFCGKKPYVRVRGREPMDDKPAKGVQSYQNYQYDVAHYKDLIYNIIKSTLIFGTGISKNYWRYKEANRMVQMPIYPEMPELGSLPQSKLVAVYDNVWFDYVDPFDFNVDPEAATIDEAEWCSHKVRRSRSYIEEMVRRKVYTNVDEMFREAEEGLGGTEKNNEKQTILNVEGHSPNKSGQMYAFDLTEYWEDDRVVTIGNGKYKLREGPNPFKHGKKPFTAAKIISSPHEFWGISLIESGAQSVKVMESLLNDGLDNFNFSINQMFGVDENRIEDTELVSAPGKFFHTRGNPQEAIYPIKGSDVAPSIFNFLGLMSDIAKRVTGVNDYMTGQTSANRTATEASLLTNEAAKRIGLHINVFGNTFVGPLAEMVHELNKQYVTADKVIRVTGGTTDPYETVRVTPDVFGADVDFIWECEDRELNNMVAVQQLTQAISIAQANPSLWGTIPIIFYKILEKFGINENDELMQMIELGKQMAMTLMGQQTMQSQMGLMNGVAQIDATQQGISNPKKVAGGSEGNIRQSMGKKTTPQHGSVANVKG